MNLEELMASTPPMQQHALIKGFQAGAASRDAEVAELRNRCKNIHSMELDSLAIERDQLREQINRLQEALHKIASARATGEVHCLAQVAIASTPEQSLAEYRNKVIEECASYCDERAKKSYLSVEKSIAAGLRAMKDQP